MKLKQKTTNFMLIVISLLAISLFASCDKDENGGTSDPICLISNLNIVWEEVCDGETWSDNEIIQFSYDSDDRLSKMEWDDGEYLLFFYNSSGKIVKIEERWDSDEVDYLHFTWDGNKVTRQWYWGDEPSSSKMIIEFNSNDEIVRVDSYYKYDEEWFHAYYGIFNWQNGNLVRIEAYWRDGWMKGAKFERREKFRKGILSKKNLPENNIGNEQKPKSTGNDFVLANTSTFTYDDKHNPFSLHQAIGLWELWSPLFLSKSNVVTWTEVETYNGEEHTWSETYQYEYNAQNHPSKLILEEGEENDCYWSQTIEFNYKNCD